MNRILIALAALAATSAMAADQAPQPAAPPASAPATTDSCVQERVTTMVVNGKTVEIRKRVANPDPKCHPQATRLWD